MLTKTDVRKGFSARVFYNRTRLDMTQQQLADGVSTSLRWIQKIESGAKLPSFFLAIRLMVVLEIDAGAFIRGLTANTEETGKERPSNDPIPVPRG